jgi:hypothetical protein
MLYTTFGLCLASILPVSNGDPGMNLAIKITTVLFWPLVSLYYFALRVAMSPDMHFLDLYLTPWLLSLLYIIYTIITAHRYSLLIANQRRAVCMLLAAIVFLWPFFLPT